MWSRCPTMNVRLGWFGYGQLLEEQGGSAVTAKQPAVAIPALEAALFYWPAPTYRRGLILIDLAGAAVQSRDIERACAYGERSSQSPSKTLDSYPKNSDAWSSTSYHVSLSRSFRAVPKHWPAADTVSVL